MHTIGGEADGLKPEAVLGIKETTEGGGRGKPPHPLPQQDSFPKGGGNTLDYTLDICLDLFRKKSQRKHLKRGRTFQK